MVTDREAWPDLERYTKALVGRFGKDERVVVWDVAPDALLSLQGHRGAVSTAAFASQDGLFSGGLDRSLVQWDLPGKKPQQFIQDSPGRLLASGGAPGRTSRLSTRAKPGLPESRTGSTFRSQSPSSCSAARPRSAGERRAT